MLSKNFSFFRKKRIMRLLQKLKSTQQMKLLQKMHGINYVTDTDGFIVEMSLMDRNRNSSIQVYLPANSKGYVPVEFIIAVIHDLWIMKK